jgi:excinuclease UvrABC ATPase subunit
LKPNERAVKGLFLGFQYPVSVPGVSIVNFLRTAMKNRRGQDISLKDFRKELKENMKVLKMDAAFANPKISARFSGGEKKRLEILQMALLQPLMAILDEPTTGLHFADLEKLASELSKKATGKTVYILDEPTTGLHFADLEKLLFVLKQLVKFGNTVIVIEHNLDIIKNADWIIDLGPEGGNRGGEIVGTGSPEDIAKLKNSWTGKYLT